MCQLCLLTGGSSLVVVVAIHDGRTDCDSGFGSSGAAAADSADGDSVDPDLTTSCRRLETMITVVGAWVGNTWVCVQ